MVDQIHIFHPIIARNLSQMGYDRPRPIQAQAASPLLEGRDLIGLAKTGSGKTAAYLAPFAHQLISNAPPRPRRRKSGRGKRGKLVRPFDPMTRLRALVLCPTRELVNQVSQEAAAIMQGSVLRCIGAHGKVAISPQARELARGVDMLIATPGRVRELLADDALSLAYIKHVAVDEADRMLDMGFLPQVSQILQAAPSDRQIALFTSTLPAEIESLAGQFLRDPVRLEADPHTRPVEHVVQRLLPVEDDDKVQLLLHMLERGNWRGVLVFCRTRRRVGWVGTALKRHGIAMGTLHGDMSQAQRKKSLDRFANRELRVLVATDLAGRGLHIPAVQAVINYDLPPTPEEFVHRIGRAAHGGGAGEAYTFLTDDKDERLRWRAISNALGVQAYAESIEGFEPGKQPPPKRNRRGRGDSTALEAQPISRRAFKRIQKPPRPTKKSRPIRKGERPGTGVKRLK